jgi:hypothetical protein
MVHPVSEVIASADIRKVPSFSERLKFRIFGDGGLVGRRPPRLALGRLGADLLPLLPIIAYGAASGTTSVQRCGELIPRIQRKKQEEQFLEPFAFTDSLWSKDEGTLKLSP